ncbi:MAG: molybdenum cofactor biosynthesis protein MoaE [Xanthobacteraceae bacterium]|nr:molybdenum cofactor biosynthesis protein MoaE [Xanthobacteraceae bacterium]
MTIPVTVRVQHDDFDVELETKMLTAGRTDVGAVVSFIGICRGGGDDLEISEMTLEHYPGMAETEIWRHADEARKRWPLTGVTVIHRFGTVTPGDNIVLVLTASAHREAAFRAAEFLMDYLKTNAPFWKSEKRVSGEERIWIDATAHDDAATSRWKK